MKISELIAAQNRAKASKLPADYVPLPEATTKEMHKIIDSETETPNFETKATLISKFGDAIWIQSDKYKTADGTKFIRNLLVKPELLDVLVTIPDGSEVQVTIEKSTVVGITQYVP
jgi:hypothetical protein